MVSAKRNARKKRSCKFIREYSIIRVTESRLTNDDSSVKRDFFRDAGDRMLDEKDKTEAYEVAQRVMNFAKNTILMRYRFFHRALSRLSINADDAEPSYRFTDSTLTYNPKRLLLDTLDEPNYAVHLLLHCMFHALFMHGSARQSDASDYWELATDIAVENVILQLGFKDASLKRDTQAQMRIGKLSKWIRKMTAQGIYREFLVNGISDDAMEEYLALFSMDRYVKHTAEDSDTIEISEQDWKNITRKVKTEVRHFKNGSGMPEDFLSNMQESLKEKQDIEAILKTFAVRGEEIKVNPDEFDYIYYSYGLKLYGKVPLIEPLEYAEINKVRDFVIAIDTSASVSETLVRDFIRKTFRILHTEDSFSSEIRVHLIQCDAEIRDDAIIKSTADLDAYFDRFSVKGYGATDFRPVFDHVDDLVRKGELDRLKGLIYFTDGYGVYPSYPPGYDVLFAFIGRDEERPDVPNWASTVFMDPEEAKEYANEH